MDSVLRAVVFATVFALIAFSEGLHFSEAGYWRLLAAMLAAYVIGYVRRA